MSTVAEIKEALQKLPKQDQLALRDWLSHNLDAEPPLHRLKAFAGAITGLPSDMAKNHDHYIHGVPKRE
ncbi:MAG TPA: hypothetical protein VEH27_15615 [Methylomirabilota bacterium]|nr:hypothetical protein [Methylomirabilota bacterium]